MSHLCLRWGREVHNHCPTEYSHLLDDLPAPLAAATRTGNSDSYAPYSMDDVRKASYDKRFTVVSLFAGGGGSSIGYRLAGGFIPLASEFIPEAARTYQLNFPESVIDRRDIRDVLCDRGGGPAFLDQAGLKVGEVDIFDGSPPCSEFSSAGAGIRDKHVMHAYSDGKQKDIASLPFDCVELAVAINPKIVVLENVPPLATKYRHVLDNLLSELCFPNGADGPTLFRCARRLDRRRFWGGAAAEASFRHRSRTRRSPTPSELIATEPCFHSFRSPRIRPYQFELRYLISIRRHSMWNHGSAQ